MQNSVVQNNIAIVSKAAIPSQSTLKDGSFVFLRVINKLPSSANTNSYIVSFRGQQFVANSTLNLQKGDAFRALVRLNDGKFTLVMQSDRSDNIKNSSSVVNISTTTEFQTFFSQLGLPFDNVSVALMRFMKLSGFQFNKKLMQKARAIAEKFPGYEQKAATVALLLAEKGIDVDISIVMEMLELLDGGQDNSSEHKHGYNHQKENKKDDSSCVLSSDIEGEDTFLSDLYENSDLLKELKNGLLSISNQIKTGYLHWIILPFAIDHDVENAQGSIRILCDLIEKKTKKAIVSFSSKNNNYLFDVSFTECLYIRFAGESFSDVLAQNNAVKKMSEIITSFDELKKMNPIVKYDSSILNQGIFPDDSPLQSVCVDI